MVSSGLAPAGPCLSCADDPRAGFTVYLSFHSFYVGEGKKGCSSLHKQLTEPLFSLLISCSFVSQLSQAPLSHIPPHAQHVSPTLSWSSPLCACGCGSEDGISVSVPALSVMAPGSGHWDDSAQAPLLTPLVWQQSWVFCIPSHPREHQGTWNLLNLCCI